MFNNNTPILFVFNGEAEIDPDDYPLYMGLRSKLDFIEFLTDESEYTCLAGFDLDPS